ncbi:PTS sugar transporter subunit IIA [Pontiella sp.]|uniref:PTS sugar transporter subunit IIA n=1 Tax=Pontiella sp. TaxID=2837462 RepID=UPI00356A1004
MPNRKLINQLIQLQELIIARLQKKAAMPKAPLDSLNTSIQMLSSNIPPQIKSHLNQLLQKHPEAVVPLVEGHCTGCGMGLSISQANEVHHAEEIHRCPNCTRYLYVPSEVVAREHASRVYGEKRKIGIARFSTQPLMITPLTGETPEDVLGEICERMQAEGFVEDGRQLLYMAMQREDIISTAVDSGMAFPHVRGVEGGGLTMALGVHKKGIHFGGPGRTLTRLFFFMVIPTATSAFYLKLLAGLSQTFRDKDARELLLNAENEEELWKALVQKTRTVIK